MSTFDQVAGRPDVSFHLKESSTFPVKNVVDTDRWAQLVEWLAGAEGRKRWNYYIRIAASLATVETENRATRDRLLQVLKVLEFSIEFHRCYGSTASLEKIHRLCESIFSPPYNLPHELLGEFACMPRSPQRLRNWLEKTARSVLQSIRSMDHSTVRIYALAGACSVHAFPSNEVLFRKLACYWTWQRRNDLDCILDELDSLPASLRQRFYRHIEILRTLPSRTAKSLLLRDRLPKRLTSKAGYTYENLRNIVETDPIHRKLRIVMNGYDSGVDWMR